MKGEHYRVDVELVRVGARHRPVDDAAVDRLAQSMKDMGLRQPITIRVVDDYVDEDGAVSDGVAVLVAGRHRLEAARRLGWEHIDAIDADDDELSAELWEIAENLHRLDLTKDQRDQHIRRYAELLEVARQVTQNAAPVIRHDKPQQNAAVYKSKGGRGNKGIPRQIAEETGLSVDTVRRALNPKPSPSPPEPVAARAPISDEGTVEKQVDAVMAAWNRACPEARERVRDIIG